MGGGGGVSVLPTILPQQHNIIESVLAWGCGGKSMRSRWGLCLNSIKTQEAPEGVSISRNRDPEWRKGAVWDGDK